MGQNICKIQTSKGRGVRQERSSNQKHTVNTNYTHKQLKCFYTNADSLINKFTELKARVESHKCMVIAITEVKPKNQTFLLNTASRTRTDTANRSVLINYNEVRYRGPVCSNDFSAQESYGTGTVNISNTQESQLAIQNTAS